MECKYCNKSAGMLTSLCFPLCTHIGKHISDEAFVCDFGYNDRN